MPRYLILIGLLLGGCASVMEAIVLPGHPKWEDVKNAADTFPRGTPRWVVKMKLGTPTASGPKEWHYVSYGNKVAEAHIYFDDDGRVTDVQTNAQKDFEGIRVIRRGRVQEPPPEVPDQRKSKRPPR